MSMKMFFINSSVEVYLSSLQLLYNMNKAIINMVEQCPYGRMESPLVIRRECDIKVDGYPKF